MIFEVKIAISPQLLKDSRSGSPSKVGSRAPSLENKSSDVTHMLVLTLLILFSQTFFSY